MGTVGAKNAITDRKSRESAPFGQYANVSAALTIALATAHPSHVLCRTVETK